VGTRKGAFVLSSDGKRKTWDVAGPHFAGWEMYHLKGSPADPNRIYASQTSGWFGQVIQRSDDGGKTWDAPGGGVTAGPGGMPTLDNGAGGPGGAALGGPAGRGGGSPMDDILIEELELGVRSYNCLKRAGIQTVGDLISKTEGELNAIPNFGKKSIDEVIETLESRGLGLRDD